jgi:hypothetical protein
MILETQAASLWIANHVRRVSDASDDQIVEFQEELQRQMMDKFSRHWYVRHHRFPGIQQLCSNVFHAARYEDNPIRGSAFRSLLIDGENMLIDELIEAAAKHAHISDIASLLLFTGGMRMWVDPKEVVCASERGRKSDIVVYRNGSSSSSSPPLNSSNSSLPAVSPQSLSPPSMLASSSPHHHHHHQSHRPYSFRRFHSPPRSAYQHQHQPHQVVLVSPTHRHMSPYRVSTPDELRLSNGMSFLPSPSMVPSPSSPPSLYNPACRPNDSYQSRAQLVL